MKMMKEAWMDLRLSRVILTVSLSWLSTCLVGAEQNARQLIERQYLKASEATRLRYYDGAVSIRHPEFKAFAPDGTQASLGHDRASLQSIFNLAVEVEEKLQILAFKQLNEKRIECEVQDTLEYVLVGSSLKDAHRHSLETRSRDIWEKTPAGWRLKETRVSKQTHSQKPLTSLPSPQPPKATSTP